MLYESFLRAFARIQAQRTLHYTVNDVSPETLPQLQANHTSQLVIYGGHSDKTIYGDPLLNHFQRAWHDTLHLELQADTSTAGEYRVARQQCLELERVSSPALANILWADLYGQTLHMEKHGIFPTDQATFVWDFMKRGLCDTL